MTSARVELRSEGGGHPLQLGAGEFEGGDRHGTHPAEVVGTPQPVPLPMPVQYQEQLQNPPGGVHGTQHVPPPPQRGHGRFHELPLVPPHRGRGQYRLLRLLPRRDGRGGVQFPQHPPRTSRTSHENVGRRSELVQTRRIEVPFPRVMVRRRDHHLGLVGESAQYPERPPRDVSRAVSRDAQCGTALLGRRRPRQRRVVRPSSIGERQGLGVFERTESRGGIGTGPSEQCVDVRQGVARIPAVEADVGVMIVQCHLSHLDGGVGAVHGGDVVEINVDVLSSSRAAKATAPPPVGAVVDGEASQRRQCRVGDQDGVHLR
mmetsp:Transcript_28953/g.85632  ORF Transcript_28953/g.85632 Transcript_28953/m.85632 type:complete len:318 (-) Transcript_28953:91-1044(-)